MSINSKSSQLRTSCLYQCMPNKMQVHHHRETGPYEQKHYWQPCILKCFLHCFKWNSNKWIVEWQSSCITWYKQHFQYNQLYEVMEGLVQLMLPPNTCGQTWSRSVLWHQWMTVSFPSWTRCLYTVLFFLHHSLVDTPSFTFTKSTSISLYPLENQFTKLFTFYNAVNHI